MKCHIHAYWPKGYSSVRLNVLNPREGSDLGKKKSNFTSTPEASLKPRASHTLPYTTLENHHLSDFYYHRLIWPLFRIYANGIRQHILFCTWLNILFVEAGEAGVICPVFLLTCTLRYENATIYLLVYFGRTFGLSLIVDYEEYCCNKNCACPSENTCTYFCEYI